jgi:hypothetical protein
MGYSAFPEVKMDESVRRLSLISALQAHRERQRREDSNREALAPLLETLARASYGYRAALNSGNRRWIAEARERWLAAQNVIQGMLDTEAA